MGLRPIGPRPIPALEDLEAVPKRQASVDAEAIRIVIHDVDSNSAAAAQKRVILKKDPTDNAHRSKFIKLLNIVEIKILINNFIPHICTGELIAFLGFKTNVMFI